jgi:BirA family biotin operon repressor/biotin-[acetyl-CoA-carboxylase] ligase
MLLNSNILHFENLSSTNTYAQTLIKTGDVREGTVIRADFQTAGRGQQGNTWESEKGMNLLFSIILKPESVEPANQFLISMSVSLGITDFLGRYVKDCRIKWPNDIYVNSDKIAGILIENSIIGNMIASSVVGIGLNLNQTKFPDGAKNAVSLKSITRKDHDTDKCLNELLADIENRYQLLLSGRQKDIRNNYLSILYRLDEWSLFRDVNGDFHGRITDVKVDGTIIIEDNTGILREYAFKEVEFTGLSSPSH